MMNCGNFHVILGKTCFLKAKLIMFWDKMFQKTIYEAIETKD